jgi:hypothetical protein
VVAIAIVVGVPALWIAMLAISGCSGRRECLPETSRRTGTPELFALLARLTGSN